MITSLRTVLFGVVALAALLPSDARTQPSDTMTQHSKLSPELSDFVLRKTEAVGTISAFLLLAGELTPDREAALRGFGVEIGSRAGDVLTCDIPIANLPAVSALDFVRYIEGSRRLHPEAP
jgi:hypothetical protein